MKFSRRIARISESATMAVSAEAGRLKREGVDIVAFGAGEPDFPTPDNIKQAAIQALADNFTRYTPAGGTPELKEAIVEWHKRDFSTDYKTNECLATVGGKHAIFNCMAALIDDGDEVVLPTPYWVTFFDVINYHGGKPVKVETQETNGFSLTAADVAAAITDRTRIVIVNSPSNPSGAVVAREEFEKIYELTSSRGIMLMTDECYCHFVYNSKPFSIASLEGAKPNVIIVGSVSKTFAMTGWRLGYVLGPAELVSNINKLQSHSTSNPTSIVQKAAIEALTGPQDSIGEMLAQYRERRTFTIDALRAIPGVHCPEPGGAFYAYPNISCTFGKAGISSPMDFAGKLLAEAHVAVVPSEAFGTAQQVRISYASSLDDLERGIGRIRKFIEELS